jgi:cation:H+ antiporter
MYNLLAVLAVPGLIAPGPFDPLVLSRDMTMMIGLTLALFVISYGFGGAGRINRFEGLLLVLAFLAYQGVLFMHTDAAPVSAPTAYQQTTEQHLT